MAEATSIQGALPGRSAELTPPLRAQRPTQREASPSVQRADDKVEVSEVAMYLSKLRELPDVRTDLVSRLRGEIASGSYDSPEKLSAAIDAMIDDVETMP
jgi:anti-sigma28 factor (negative regulator of flagellin synthesis)